MCTVSGILQLRPSRHLEEEIDVSSVLFATHRVPVCAAQDRLSLKSHKQPKIRRKKYDTSMEIVTLSSTFSEEDCTYLDPILSRFLTLRTESPLPAGEMLTKALVARDCVAKSAQTPLEGGNSVTWAMADGSAFPIATLLLHVAPHGGITRPRCSSEYLTEGSPTTDSGSLVPPQWRQRQSGDSESLGRLPSSTRGIPSRMAIVYYVWAIPT
ncbi:hypothetical protein C8J57DRAFT_1478546, partial [Mycena rebaudengoi]